jgi:hypothetical protein
MEDGRRGKGGDGGGIYIGRGGGRQPEMIGVPLAVHTAPSPSRWGVFV